MKRHLTIASTILAGLLVTAVTLPAIAQQRRERVAKDDAEKAWKADSAEVEKPRGPRGEGFEPGMGMGEEMGFDGPRPPRGPGHGPEGPGFGPGGPGGPGIEGALQKATALLFPFWENEEAVADLGLTPDQVSALAASGDLTKSKLEETEGSIQDAAEDLRDEMQKDAPEVATVNSLIDGITAATNEKAKIILGHAVVVKNVLSEEQEEQLKEVGQNIRRQHGEEMRELMQDVRETLQNGGTLDDVLNLIETSSLPDHAKERLVKFAEERAEKVRSAKK